MKGLTRRLALLARDVVINGLAAWPVVPGQLRRAIYNAYGMRIETGGISPRCFFGSPAVAIGRGTTVNYGCFFDSLAAIEIGCDCAIGMEVLVCTSGHDLGPGAKRAGRPVGRPIKVGNGCWIGARVAILPGVSIGDGCVVAAGAVVTHDCAADGLYAGMPARRVRELPGRETSAARNGTARTRRRGARSRSGVALRRAS